MPECGRGQVLTPALSGEGDVESRAAERGVIHPDLAAVAVHDFGHHGEANPLAGGAVSPHAALEDLLRFAGIDAGTVVFHHDEQAALPVADMNPDLADGEFAGVVQQVAHQLHQIALLAVKEDIVVKLEAGLQLLVAIDLGEAGQQLLDEGNRFGALAREALSPGDGAAQLVLDDLIHGGDLFIDVVMDVVAELELLGGDLDERQPGFQAVGEIVEGVLVALGLLAFVLQQLVDRACQGGQFALVVV